MAGAAPNKRHQSVEWFRDSAWDRATRDQYEEHLIRARVGNRPQYLRIKALALRDAGEFKGATELLNRVVSDYPDEALRLLDSALKRGRMMNSDLFRWNIALARVAEQLGDAETVSRAARAALSLTKLGPQYPRHPTVGLARPDAATLAWLEKAAAG
jgi:hypothetical protein